MGCNFLETENEAVRVKGDKMLGDQVMGGKMTENSMMGGKMTGNYMMGGKVIPLLKRIKSSWSFGTGPQKLGSKLDATQSRPLFETLLRALRCLFPPASVL